MTAKLAGIIMLLLGLIVAALGYWITNSKLSVELIAQDFYTNVSTDLLFTALTVLVIDSLSEKRAEKERKQSLILQMGSSDRGFAVEAARILKVQGWLVDGSVNCAILEGANLYKANLEGASLQQVDLQRANLIEANLRNVDLSNANLKNSNLSSAFLYEANLKKASLFNAILDNADLCGACLQGADLFDASLIGADLRNADLTDAELYGADLTDADVSGVITKGIKCNERTRLPSSMQGVLQVNSPGKEII